MKNPGLLNVESINITYPIEGLLMKKPTYIDLFAGCGGLSLGLERAGFELALAVEKSDMAAETFYHNFIERIRDKEDWKKFCALPVSKQAEKKLIVGPVSDLLDDKILLKKLRDQKIDLIAGGPPCQGFSLAGRRNPDDIRNELPWQFLDVVKAVQPRAVIIENVVGMSHDFVKHDRQSPFDQLKQALQLIEPGYVAQQVHFNAMHFGAPQHRPRVMILALRADFAEDFTFFDGIWRSDFDESGQYADVRPGVAPVATHFGKDIKTVRDAIWDLNDKGYRYASDHHKYFENDGGVARDLRQDRVWMPENIRKTNEPGNLQNHTLRKHNDQIKKRFRLYQVLRDYNLSSTILNIPKRHGETEAIELLKKALQNTKSEEFIAPDKTLVAKNKPALIKLIMELGTKKHSQRPLKWDAPSPTVVSLPDDFVHPQLPRTLTVRELARFQSFPDSFVFRAKETTGSHRRRFEVPQYTQVGNAVPPIMAEVVGKRFREILNKAANTKQVRRREKVAA